VKNIRKRSRFRRFLRIPLVVAHCWRFGREMSDMERLEFVWLNVRILMR